MNAKTYSLYLLVFFAFAGFSQDPLFLNTTQSLVYLNPSFAGSNGGIRGQFSYYNQWPNLGAANSFATGLGTVDAFIKPLKAGIAVSLLNDNASSGRLKATTLSFAYAQHLSFAGNTLKIIPSVQLGYGQRVLDSEHGLTYGDMIDPRMGVVWNTQQVRPINAKSYLDMSAGLLVNYKKNLYAGVSVFHFNQPDVGLLGVYPLPYNFTAHASYNFHAQM